MMKREIDAFEGMMRTAREWLAGRDPWEIARNAGVSFDGSAFALSSLGEEIRVSFPAYEIEPRLDPWRQMVLLHYLKLADGAPLYGRLMAFAELKSGLARGGDFDRGCEAAIRDRLGGLDPEALRAKCEGLGARMLDSNADLCAEFPYLPRFPLTLKLWFADEEFPASGRLMLDASADHYLTIEDAVTAGQLLMYKLTGVP